MAAAVSSQLVSMPRIMAGACPVTMNWLLPLEQTAEKRAPASRQRRHTQKMALPTIGSKDIAIVSPLRPDRNTWQPAGTGPGPAGAALVERRSWRARGRHRH